MMSDYKGRYTNNLNLSKDDPDDSYDVTRVNSNTDKIDKFAGEVTTQFNERALKTYVTLEQLGITENTDIISIIEAMPVYSMLVTDVRNTVTITNALPYLYSTLTIVKCNSSRNFIRLMSVDGREWISSYNVSGEALADWQQVATISQVITMLEAYQLKTV